MVFHLAAYLLDEVARFGSGSVLSALDLVAPPPEEGARFGPVPVLLAFLTLGINWILLPRSRDATPLRKLGSLSFLAVVFLVGDLTGSVLFYFVAVVNGVYVFGLAGGFAYACAALVLLNVQSVLIGWSASREEVLKDTLFLWGPALLFVIGVSAAAVEADRRTRQARELLEELEEAHLQLARYAAKVRELSAHEERTRIARDIHDSMGHYITAAGLHLEAAQKLVCRDPGKAEERLTSARTSLSGALSEVRRSVQALKPLDQEDRSSSDALRTLTRSFEDVGPKVAFEVCGEERELPQEAELVLYRALQEGLTNALKHANACEIRAQLAFEPDMVRLSVADDGSGVPKDASGGGFGLKALEDRVEDLGGRFEASEVAGGGFLLSVELPTGFPESERTPLEKTLSEKTT